ncbi:MAG: DUF1351 domain-containing protein, partial [Ruminococcus sp.]|nr:DUF1351 domain-containing protein [Ruminococcus sp.]
MELSIITKSFDLPADIDNIEAVNNWLIPIIEEGRSLVVTKDGIKSAKDKRADLNRIRKAVDKSRMTMKKDCLRPYELMEEKYNRIFSWIDEPIQAIDKQLKVFE